jgi:phosphoglycerol transferase
MSEDSSPVIRSTTPRTDVRAAAVIAVFILVATGRALFVDNSVIFHDEYVYKISGDRHADQSMVLARRLAEQIPNRLYLKVFGLTSELGSNAYVGARLLNVMFWALGLWALFRLAQRTGLSDQRSLGFLVVASLLPSSVYTHFFMPEAMYFAMFSAAALALFTGVVRERTLPIVLAGAMMGLMYFVKPHALALIAATGFFLLLLPGRVAFLVRFVLGVAPIYGGGKWLISEVSTSGAGLGVYRSMLEGLMLNLTKPNLSAELFEVARGHLLFFMVAFGLSLVAAGAVLLPRLGLNRAPVPLEFRRLALLVLVLFAALGSMAVVFTALVGELGRIHSRYYFFLFPLALLLLFHLPTLRFSAAGRVVGALVVIGGAAGLALWGPSYSWVLHISLVGDGPEWGFVFGRGPQLYLLMAGLVVTGLWTVWRTRAVFVYLAVLGACFFLSSTYVTSAERGTFRGLYTTGREASAVETYLGREAMQRAMVIGENRDAVSKFLFGLSTTPFAEQVPDHTDLTALLSGRPEVTSIVVLFDGYVIPSEFSCSFQIPGAKVCHR